MLVLQSVGAAAAYAAVFPLEIEAALAARQQQEQQERQQVGYLILLARTRWTPPLGRVPKLCISCQGGISGAMEPPQCAGMQEGAMALPPSLGNTSDTCFTSAELAHYSTDEFRMFAFKVGASRSTPVVGTSLQSLDRADIVRAGSLRATLCVSSPASTPCIGILALISVHSIIRWAGCVQLL